RDTPRHTSRLLTPPAKPPQDVKLLSDVKFLSHVLVLDNAKNSTADTAQALKLPCDVAGRIAQKNDRHWYSFRAKKGEVWRLEVVADRIGSPIDAYFQLTDEK